MEITGPAIRVLSDGVSTKFKFFLDSAASQWKEVATEVQSTGRGNFYPKLDEIPGMRKWIGPRVIHELSLSSYYIKNETFEETIGIDRDDIEDDQFGMFNLAIDQLGKNAAELPDLLVFSTLKVGATTKCYDGQYYFDQNHVNFSATGAPVQYSNYQTGAGPSWYLIDDTKPLKPLIYQPRRAAAITAKIKLDDDNVFEQKRFVWGVDMRCAAGFGLWQVAYRSDAPLTMANYAAARAAMGSLRRLDGAPLGITPNKLIVPPALEGAANALANNDIIASLNPDGATYSPVNNQWKGTVRPVKVPWLA